MSIMYLVMPDVRRYTFSGAGVDNDTVTGLQFLDGNRMLIFVFFLPMGPLRSRQVSII